MHRWPAPVRALGRGRAAGREGCDACWPPGWIGIRGADRIGSGPQDDDAARLLSFFSVGAAMAAIALSSISTSRPWPLPQEPSGLASGDPPAASVHPFGQPPAEPVT